jgi:excisionase family DNA binding protein
MNMNESPELKPSPAGQPGSPEVLAYRVGDAVLVSGLSRTTLYSLMAKGLLRTVKVGGRRLIPRDALAELLQPNDR